MNIGYYNLTTTTKHGGVESFVWEVARRMADAGHRVTIYGGRGDVLRDYPQLQIRQYRFIAREVWGRSRILRRSLNLLKLLERLSMAATALPDLRRAGHDLIQISKPYDLPVVAAARYRGPRLVYNSQGTDFFSGDRFFRRTIDAAFACSRYNAAMVEARYRIPLDVSYNGFDEQRFHPQPADAGLRARLAPDGAPLILYVGRLVTFKGLDYLLDAIGILRDRHTTPMPRLLLAGNGPHHAQLVARTQRLGIGAFVTFLGPQPNHELPHYHAVSDMLVLPSTDHETFGIAACEAMGCGRPVVAAHTGGLPEVVRHGETGLLAAPADATALADAIGTLLGDAALRERMGTAAAEWVRAMFTWDRVVGRVLHSYETALATGAGRE